MKAAAESKAQTRAKAAGAANQTGEAAKPGVPAAAGAQASSIPAGVSAAEASQTILDLAALDGKMLSSRQILDLLEKVMSLPPSHMEEASVVIQESKNMIMSGFLYSALFSRWGELDPEAAKKALETGSGSNPILKFAGAASLAGGWLEKDPDNFIKWLSDSQEGASAQDKEMKGTMMNGVLAMTEVDSATAEKLIAAAPKDRRAWMIMDMAERDPSIDPREAAARALAEAGDDEGQRGSINWRVSRMLADRDPKEAIKYAETLTNPREQGQTYESAMNSWMDKDKPAAMKWLKEQPESVQVSAVRGMRGELKEMSFEEVTKLSGEVSGKASAELWSMGLQQTAQKNPEEALRYLPNVAEDQRPYSYQQIAQSWTKKDPEAASSWIDPMPPGKEKDNAIQGMVEELRTKEPDSSTIWASTIEDEGTRTRLLNENAKLWLKRDRPAAEEWINSTDTLTDDQRAKLLEVK